MHAIVQVRSIRRRVSSALVNIRAREAATSVLACHLWKPPIWCTPRPVVMTRG
jgi:hypothetical protein